MGKSTTKINVVTIGGGTGTSVVLQSLKKHLDKMNLSTIITMMDDGGCNAVIRNELGLQPLSDIRQALLALSQTKEKILEELLSHRFSKGTRLGGITLGNLMLAALAETRGDEVAAIRALSKLLEIEQKIVPVTLDDVALIAKYDDNTIAESEHRIDEPDKKHTAKIAELTTKPRAKANPVAIKEIKAADWIIIGPGDLYTSLIANLVVSNISQTIANSKAKIVYIANLMTKHGQTAGMGLSAHTEELKRYLGKYPDFVIYNSGEIPRDALPPYKKRNEKPVENDLTLPNNKFRLIKRDIVKKEQVSKAKGDLLVRSTIRHSPQKLGRVLIKLFTHGS